MRRAEEPVNPFNQPSCRGEIWIKGERTPVTKALSLCLAAGYSPYLGAGAGALFAGCWIELFPITIISPLNGGDAFAGNSGRKTANACETNAMEMITIAGAHLMSGRFIRFKLHDK